MVELLKDRSVIALIVLSMVIVLMIALLITNSGSGYDWEDAVGIYGWAMIYALLLIVPIVVIYRYWMLERK